MKCCRLLSERLARWVLFLQQFNQKIEHIKGSENKIPDLLSRYPCDADLPSEQRCTEPIIAAFSTAYGQTLKGELKNLLEIQELDPRLSKIIEILKRNKLAEADSLNQLVKSHCLTSRGLLHLDTFRKRYTIATPQVLIRPLIEHCHQELDHAGAGKVYLVMGTPFTSPFLTRPFAGIQVVATCVNELKGLTKRPAVRCTPYWPAV